MAKCCIQECDSSKGIGTQNCTFFNFPLHDEILLKKWLKPMGLQKWKPTHHKICSLHFAEEDIDRHPNRTHPCLKPTAIPTIFPIRKENTTPLNQRHHPTILRPLPSPASSETTNVGINGSYNLPVIPSGPFILVPLQYSVLYHPQGHILIPTQFLQVSPQNSNEQNSQLSQQTNTENPAENSQSLKINPTNPEPSGQFSKQTIDQNSVQTFKSTLINLKNSEQTSELSETIPKSSAHTSLEIPYPSPTLTEELPEISEHDADCFEILQPRLAKNLQKPGTHPALQSDSIRPVFQSESISKPDILIVPRFRSSNNPNGSNIPRYPGNKTPTLRITINKRCDGSTDGKTHGEKEKSAVDEDSCEREITIKNLSANKSVTFRLDRETGEIVSETREIADSSRDMESPKSSRTKRKVDTCPSSAMPRRLYARDQRECGVLRNQLSILRRYHRREQREIQKLREHLSELEDRLQKQKNKRGCPDEETTLMRLKKCDEKTSVVGQSINDREPEKYLREAKKPRGNIENVKKNDSLKIPNGHRKCQLMISSSKRRNRGKHELRRKKV